MTVDLIELGLGLKKNGREEGCDGDYRYVMVRIRA